MADATAAAAAAAAAAASYKHRKEAFVSNLTGGSVGEVFLVSAVAPVAVLAACAFDRYTHDPLSTALAVAVDFCFNVAAILLATTIYADRVGLLLGLLLVLAVVGQAVRPRGGGGGPTRSRAAPYYEEEPFSKEKKEKKSPKQGPRKRAPPPKRAPKAKANSTTNSDPPPLPLPRKFSITAYRGCMMIVTCVAILAVDFRIFPRRFAKVETWGTSLMDMGVGSFVFSAGVVGARPLLLLQRGGGSGAVGGLRAVLDSLRHALPLFVLGVIRLLSVKGLDYAEHVSEYGVHWNFFFTLALLPPFVAAAQALRAAAAPSAPLALVALLIAGGYEVALDPRVSGLRAFVLTAPRTGLLSQNREGLASFVGYLAIFLAGQATGLYVLRADVPDVPSETRKTTTKTTATNRLLAQVVALARARPLLPWTVAWWALHQVAVARAPWGLGLTESRRLANLPYVLWVVSFNTLQLTLFTVVGALADMWTGPHDGVGDGHGRSRSRILHAFNRNGLVLFLAANLLTGLVNMTVPTLDASPAMAMGILLAYTGALTALAVGLDACDVTIKL